MIVGNGEHPIERIMENAFSKMKTLIDADTVIGSPVRTSDGVSIVPISKITLGFLTGGGEYSDMSRQSYTEYPFAGGSGAGLSVAPVGFLVSDGKTVKFIGVDDKSVFDKVINLIPDVVANILEGGTKKK